MSARIGAYDAAGWAGLVLAPAPGFGYALRLVVEKDGARADGDELFFLVHEVGPHDPDGGYARVAFDTELPFGLGNETPILARSGRSAGLVLEWARPPGEDRACLRARVGFEGVLELRAYFPWDWRGSFEVEGTTILGRTQGSDRRLVLASALTGAQPSPATQALDGEAALRFAVRPGDLLRLRASLEGGPGPARIGAPDAFDPGAIDEALAAGAAAYERRRVAGEGDWEGLPDAVTNNIHWMVLLQPETGRRYTPAGRRWIFPAPSGGRDHWTIFEWDSFFNALELAVESPELAGEALAAVLDTQYPNGNVPNWRGRGGGTPDRSQPPVGAYAVLKLHARTGDRWLLELAFPALERWSAWWRAPRGRGARRDGNGDGLYEWGSDARELGSWTPAWETDASGHTRAGWESGEDDLPSWQEAEFVEDASCFDLASVDLNALLVLDDECLGRIAEELGELEKARLYRERAARHKALVERQLWDEGRGLYLDRGWDGRVSPRLAAANFLPLLAGIPSPARAERLARALADPGLFWGEFVIPSISRDDPLFHEQQYWRGTIWPPTNYLVCQGLRRYGFDALAADVAARSVRLFLSDFRAHQLCRENFDSRSGQGGGQRHQSWGPLFALLGIEEFVDATPWEGLRLGSLRPPNASLRRIRLRGHEWSVRTSEAGLEVSRDGAPLLSTDGPAVLRQVEWAPRRLELESSAERPFTLRPAFRPRWAEIDGAEAPLTAQGALGVSAGRCTVTIGG